MSKLEIESHIYIQNTEVLIVDPFEAYQNCIFMWVTGNNDHTIRQSSF